MTTRETGLNHAPESIKISSAACRNRLSIAGTAVLSIGLPALLETLSHYGSPSGDRGGLFSFFKFIFFRLFRKHTARIEAFPA